jgi:hypothetical protein
MLFDDVKAYIGESIFNSASFDNLPEDRQIKAVNQAEKSLYLLFKNYNPDTNPLPVEAVTYQTLWVIAKDSNVQKADLGVSSVSIDGMAQSFSNVDRTVSPEVKRILSKRLGSYNLSLSQTRRGVYY